MDDNIKKYINEINVLKNKMIGEYANLVADYEKYNHCCKEIIEQHETQLNDPSIPVQCNKIIANNYSWTVTRWVLLALDGKVIYMSDYYAKGTHCTIDLDSLYYIPGQQFRLKAIVLGNDSTNPQILEYSPDTYYEARFSLRGNAFDTKLYYYG